MTTMTAAPDRNRHTGNATIDVERWPTEQPLFALAVILSGIIWLALTVSIIGIAYAAFLGVFFFFMHVGFVAHVRGSGVRLGPDQFPDLHARVQELGDRMGMDKLPDAYLIQAGGSLNALATRFLRSHMIILFSDLLEACGDDHAARDMIIGHELGHIRAGHLRWHWFLLPAKLVPFLGGALSRAREYTCDRFGLAAAGDRDGALLGLTILAAGGAHGRQVNRAAMVRQRADLNTGWMTLGQWLSTHPPLAKRLVALDPALGAGQRLSSAGAVRALLILALLWLPLIVGATAAVVYIGRAAQATTGAVDAAPASLAGTSMAPDEVGAARAELERMVAEVSAFLDAELAAGRALPGSWSELSGRWETANPGAGEILDPFDGLGLGYTPGSDGYTLWSSGPDGAAGTADDISYDFGR